MYLNVAETKRRILEKVARDRPGCKFTRVSDKAIRQLDTRIDEILDKAVWAHPSPGKTFKGFV